MIERWPLRDPCSTYYLARTLAARTSARDGDIRRSIEGGFHAYSLLMRDPWLDPLRDEGRISPRWCGWRRPAIATPPTAFGAAGGERLLGPVRRIG